jgi:quinol-cytochrome oxidoreductase complex cytochrome b subunit
MQFLWEKCQQHHEHKETASPLMLEFAQKLAEALPLFTESTPITPQWIFTPFVSVLKNVISTVIRADSHRVVRISFCVCFVLQLLGVSLPHLPPFSLLLST